ncbi:MAG TPA: chromosome segregation protein SMC [Acidimicrobiales bacterium]|nr:chromosome segregation protein SMC [Acidimicrobiales bacterium]
MFLKRLTIKGFKSFADIAALEMEPGVTVVVGPNGSGKSNVVDAIAWVLGAQAPSAVRAQKMDDIIFAGTASRPALGRAEVSLTIDNESGLLPIEFSEVTITRTLFRSGDSEYSLNGAPCRLLDIQELLSDAGVGRQQHVIVSQGQIDAVLNARPEERRMIIEDAAGILKYRKRKEKAERRLSATETNLNRLGDLQREVRRQLRPLEKQAEAARRHGDLISELTALRLHRAANELNELRERTQSESNQRADLVRQETEMKGNLARLDTEVVAAEAELSARGGDDLSDQLVRHEALRERARGLRGILTERLRSIENDRKSSSSHQIVFDLESELARSEAELAGLEIEVASFAPKSETLSALEEKLNEERTIFDQKWGDGIPVSEGLASEVRGELSVLRSSVQELKSEHSRVTDRLSVLDASFMRLDTEAKKLRELLSEGDVVEEPLIAEVVEMESQAGRSVTDREQAWERLVAAEADLRTIRARVEALALALDEARSRAGVNHLADIEGVLGTLLDLVEVDAGYESAFEAAAGEALDAVVVEGTDQAVKAIEALKRGNFNAAVLNLHGLTSDRTKPTVGASIRQYVRAQMPEVNELLDRLLAEVAVITTSGTTAIDLAISHPDTVIVTTEGDRFGPSGWKIGGDRSGATGAALAETEVRLVAAEMERTDAKSAFEEAEKRANDLSQEVNRLNQSLNDHDNEFTTAVEALQQLQSERRELATEIGNLQNRVGEITDRLENDQDRVTELERRLSQLEEDEEKLTEAAHRMIQDRNQLEKRVTELTKKRTDHEVRYADVTARKALINTRLVDQQNQLVALEEIHQEASTQRDQLDRRETVNKRLVEVLDQQVEKIEVRLANLRDQRQQQSDRVQAAVVRLDGIRRDRLESERRLSGVRERQSRLEIERAESRLRLENLSSRIRTEFDKEPDSILETPEPELPTGVSSTNRISELEHDLKIMGPINPLALEEFETLNERYEFLQEQLEDVRTTRRELRKVIRSIDEEIVRVFSSAWAEVSEHFTDLFGNLFPGGTGSLRLTDTSDLLSTGIEVEARPSGKNVKKLSLLSGGERSLTALAFLFAVFRSRPSPFYVMDEVEAALDDVNLHRFLGLVRQFRDDAQLLIVSHQKRTMEAADCLYGVSMAPGGSSQVVSERMDNDQIELRTESVRTTTNL